LKNKRIEPFYEIFDWQSLRGTVIGVDEVGRGCLAGSVYAAAVILDPKNIRDDIQDSKTLSEIRREKISAFVLENHRYAIAFASVEEIETYNIFQASLLAMKRAVEALKIKTAHILVDGKFTIPGLRGYKQTALIKGDRRAMPIAAASIIAKVARDREMKALALEYEGYGFEEHKGYATEQHQNAILKLGPCPIHRKTFGGVREYIRIQNESASHLGEVL
jgi:ribonuclease HII